jgi:hypothetical protein
MGIRQSSTAIPGVDLKSKLGTLGALWGIAGFLLLLGIAVSRLAPPAAEALGQKMHWYQWVLLVVSGALLLYAKGYRGFQRGLSARVVRRALTLAGNPKLLNVAAAPLYCMGFFGAGRRRMVTMIALTAIMVGLIFVVRLLDQPWRGIIDFGIVLAFAWGIASAVVYAIRAIGNERPKPGRN